MSSPARLRVQLDEVELKIKEMGYFIRTSKGLFRSSPCVVKQSKLILINKSLDLESKLTFLRTVIEKLTHE